MRYGNRKRLNSQRRTSKNRSGRRLFLESLESRALLAGIHDVVETADHLHHDASTLVADVAQTFVAEGEHTAESAGEHIHARLTVFVDGTQAVIPTNVGVGPTGFLSQIHTHDNTGELHIHPIGTELRDRTLTLGDFFETWRTNAGLAGNNANAILSATQLFNNVSNTTDTVKMFVNGQVSDQFSNHLLHDGDNIVLVYGSDPVVSLNTNFGSIVIELFENETPGTVNNFLNYVNDGDYINSFFHRSADSGGADFVIQGGGFRTTSTTFTSTAQFSSVPTDPPIQNEPGISNVRGTVAMAKTSDPNSATSQFFVNLNDANTFLDSPSNSGGFTVFGQVLDLRSSDTIAALPIRTNPSPYGELPVSTDNQLVVIQSIVGRGEISGTHFNDTNRNGVRDSGETAIAGATVFIDANNNGVLDPGELSTATDATGRYLFQVDPGSYRVRVQFDSALSLTVPSAADSYLVTVEIGREEANRNFGVAEVNDRPLTQSDAYSVNEDAVLTVAVATGVLANDASQTSAALTAAVNTQPANGSLTLNSNGSFTYTPTANFFGTDTFTYIASDGTNQSVPTTVTITVNAQPDPPVAAADSLTISNSRTPRTIDVLANDTSAPDGVQALTVTSVTQGTSGGTVTLANGVVSYLAPEGFIGTDTFTYTIQDTDALSSSATVTINVTEVANNSVSGFVFIDADGDGLRGTGEVGVPGAQITLTGSGITRTILTDTNGAYSFTELPAGTYQLVERQPVAMLDGIDSTTVPNAIVGNNQITTIVLNGGQNFTENNFGEMGIQSQYLSIVWFFASSGSPEVMFRETIARGEELDGNMALAATIRAGGTEVPEVSNSAPIASDDQFTVNENSVLTVTAASGVLNNDTDVDGDTLTATLLTQPTHGTLNFNVNGSFTYTPTSGSGFFGTDTFTYRAHDGIASSNTATVTITVNPLNPAPITAADSYTLEEDSVLTVNAANGVLANDSAPGGATLTAVLVEGPAHGTLSLNADGSFTYTPVANFSATDAFTYAASDGTRTSGATTVTITVLPHSDAPVAVNDGFTTMVDQTLVINAAAGVIANDSDPNGDSLTVTLQSSPANGAIALSGDGSFTYTPNTGFTGTDSFTYTASDGSLTSNTATVTITVATL
ncbi:MAG TPA: Ig-like domain-containing protein, partial [Pirellulaceae bacterium]|nr:Ig-like domain-containing protein [Pirellulaceae bacterium]